MFWITSHLLIVLFIARTFKIKDMFEKYNKEEEQEQKALFIEFVSKLLPTYKEIIAKA